MRVMAVTRDTLPRPFLKWAGGKTQLLPELLPRVAAARPFGRYHEPFAGGAALFFALVRTGWLDGPATLSDSNARLVEVYAAVRDEAAAVIEHLRKHATRHSEAHYYAVRARVPRTLAARAARLIYLNRTCFNGLYRENRRGEFNVPMGRYKNPRICDAEALMAASVALQKAEVACRPFEAVLDHAQPGDFVYFDPPYAPLSATSSFTAYSDQSFGAAEHDRLAEVVDALAARGVKVLLSNSDTPANRARYAAHTVATLAARRAVNSRADRRGPVQELLVSAG